MPHKKYIKSLVDMYQRGKPTPDGGTTGLDEGEELRKEEALQIGSWNTSLCFPGQVGHPTQCGIAGTGDGKNNGSRRTWSEALGALLRKNRKAGNPATVLTSLWKQAW